MVEGAPVQAPPSRASATAEPTATRASPHVVAGGSPARLAEVDTSGPAARLIARARDCC